MDVDARMGLRLFRTTVNRRAHRPGREEADGMPRDRGRSLLIVPAWAGQVTTAELDRQAAADIRPRSDYVELARALDADIMDRQYLTERATAVTRAVARTIGLVPAQIVEAYLRRGRDLHILARAGPVGVPLAPLVKVSGGRRGPGV